MSTTPGPPPPAEPTAPPRGWATSVGRMGAQVASRVDAALSRSGPDFRRLILANSASTAGDTLVALALAGTLFFSVPSAEARANVALYLVLTLAPFIVLAPVLGALLARYPTAYRYGLVASSLGRGVVAVIMAARLTSFWLYPLAFLLLVLSRLFAISRASLLPVALEQPTSLVAANARLAQIGVAAGGLALPIGIVADRLVDPSAVLVVSAAVFVAGAWAAGELRAPVPHEAPVATPEGPPAQRHPRSIRAVIRGHRLPRAVRLAQLATAGVRLLNGFLLLLLAFALRSERAGLLDFGALLAAGGLGYLLAALVSPWLERRLREEPMVLAALAIEAGAAFVAAQAFGLAAAAALAGAAGLAWGTAKFAFDGLLQSTVPPAGRGVSFTRSETLFAIAWVLGAIIPVALPVPVAVGLSAAGLAALAAQVTYVASLLLPDGARGD